MTVKKSKRLLYSLLSTIALAVLLCCMVPVVAHAASKKGGTGEGLTTPTPVQQSPTIPAGDYSCGGGTQAVPISIDLGCQHQGNPILDATFAIIRILSDGVGLVIVASLIWAGIQYTGSRGDPQSTALAVKRIRSNVLALFIFIFAYAILNYIVPGKILQ